jgi:site-specific DNA recombinase
LIFRERNVSKAKEKAEFEQRLTVIRESIDKVKLRFGIGEIGKDVYETSTHKLHAEESQLVCNIAEADFQLSNHRPFVDFALNLSQNLDQAWLSANARIKRMLQNTIFPDGITYDKLSKSYRTQKVNGLFNIFHSVSEIYKNKGEEQACYPSPNSDLVVPTGLTITC